MTLETIKPIVLSAGASSRMGHPKALTPIDGAPALAHIVNACRDAMLARPVVVLGHEHERIRRALASLEVEWLVNGDPDAGRTGSLKLALLATHVDEAVVWPVDHPLASATIPPVLARAQGEWVVPEHAGRGGHPILLRRRAIDAVLAAPSSLPLRDALAAVAQVRVRVDDPGVLANLDAPADLAPGTVSWHSVADYVP